MHRQSRSLVEKRKKSKATLEQSMIPQLVPYRRFMMLQAMWYVIAYGALI